jgi:hypothetical protein
MQNKSMLVQQMVESIGELPEKWHEKWLLMEKGG